MRARNIKPSLFTNEHLAMADPINTVIFIGLWCLADRAGRLEHRVAKIHLAINPGRPIETTQAALEWLENKGFLTMYESGGRSYIEVVNFTKHQHPHVKEPPSTIPAPDSPGADPVQIRLIPDSGSLIPDSGSLITDNPIPVPAPEPDPIEQVRPIYPKRGGSQPWQAASKALHARLREGASLEDVLAGVRRYAAFCEATGKAGTEVVMMARTFLGPEKHFMEEWVIPAEPLSFKERKAATSKATLAAWTKGESNASR